MKRERKKKKIGREREREKGTEGGREREGGSGANRQQKYESFIARLRFSDTEKRTFCRSLFGQEI